MRFQIRYIRDLEHDPQRKLLESICEFYWSITDGEFDFNVTEIAQSFGLNTRQLLNIVFSASVLVDTEWTCMCCSDHYIYKTKTEFIKTEEERADRYIVDNLCGFTSRESEILKHAYERDLHYECLHQMLKDQRQTWIESLREKIKLHNSTCSKGPMLGNSNFRPFFNLFVLMLHYHNFDLSTLKPLNSKPSSLTPNDMMTREAIVHLIDYGYLKVSEKSDPRTLSPGEDPDNYKFSIFEVDYLINYDSAYDLFRSIAEVLGNLDSTREYIDDLDEYYYTDEIYAELADYQIEIISEEIIQYAAEHLKTYRLLLEQKDECRIFFTKLLTNGYSAGQICYFIWACSRDLAAQIQQGFVPFNKAMNGFSARMVNKITLFEDKGWTAPEYNHFVYNERSLVSSYLQKVLNPPQIDRISVNE